MVSVAQLAEHQTVALGVVGSSPTAHPKNFEKCLPFLYQADKIAAIEIHNANRRCRGVAQFGSALALGARGCQFESGRPDHFLLFIKT